jgi:hypothetical protein
MLFGMLNGITGFGSEAPVQKRDQRGIRRVPDVDTDDDDVIEDGNNDCIAKNIDCIAKNTDWTIWNTAKWMAPNGPREVGSKSEDRKMNVRISKKRIINVCCGEFIVSDQIQKAVGIK